MTFQERVTGVLKLQAAAFEEVERDRTANGQALAVVVLASLATGVGAGLLFGPLVLVRETFAALVGWVMWAAVTYVIGARIVSEPQTRTDMGELLRVIGFAYAPGLFNLLGLVPVLGWVVRAVVALWVLAATVVAVRQALDYRSTWRALAVVVIGWLFFVFITLLF